MASFAEESLQPRDLASKRARNASNASSGKSHGLDADLATNQARAVAICSRVPLRAQKPELGTDKQSGPPLSLHKIPVFAYHYLVIRPVGCQSDQCASLRPQTVAGRHDRFDRGGIFGELLSQTFRRDDRGSGSIEGEFVLCALNSVAKTRLQQSSSSELPGLSRDSATSPGASSTTDSSSQYSRNLVLKRGERLR